MTEYQKKGGINKLIDKTEFRCIYLSKVENNLSYTSREHIIPAGLGGKEKLPLGMVSNEANASFSKIELRALRNTILAHNRNVLGPGRRGTLSVKKVSNPKIQILLAEKKENSKCIDIEYAPQRLGFLFRNNVYFIPQILFPINDDWTMPIPRFIMDNVSDDNFFEIHKLFYYLHIFIKDKQRKFIIINTDLDVNNKFVLIGSYKNKWFVGTNLNNKNLNNFIKILELYPLPDDIPALVPSECKYNYSMKLDLDESMSFVYVKTAFNILAFFMGFDFVMDNQFDNVRNSIKNCAEISDLVESETLPEWLISWYKSEVKPKEHFIVIDGTGNYIKAYVSFYGERPGTVLLSNNYCGESFKKSFVCNWEHGEERYINM